MSTRPRAPGRAGKAAAVAAAGVVEASAVDPFSFDGSQDELLGAVVEAGAAPEALNQALQQAGAAAPGPSPRLVSPTAASKAASRDTPGRPSPSPRAARQKRSSQGGGAADAARPDGGGGEEDPFCFDASDTAKRFENLPPDLPAATRVTAAVRRLTIRAVSLWRRPRARAVLVQLGLDSSPPKQHAFTGLLTWPSVLLLCPAGCEACHLGRVDGEDTGARYAASTGCGEGATPRQPQGAPRRPGGACPRRRR